MKRKFTALLPLVLVVVLTILSILQLPSLRFNYHFEAFFPENDPDLTFFNDFKEKFGNDNDYILVGIREEGGIFDEEFLKEVSSLSDSLSNLRYVESVTGPTDLTFLISGPFGPVNASFLHPDEPDRYASDSIRIYSQKEITGPFFSEDATAVNILIQTIQEPSKEKSDSIVLGLERILENFQFYELHLAGKVPAQYHYINRMQRELFVFISIAVVLLILILTIMFRSFWAVVAPLLIVFLSIIWLLGVMSITGKNIDLIMTLMPTMLFVVGMSDAIHFLSRYTEIIREGYSKIAAIKITVKEIGVAVFLTSLTTAVGFLTLITVSITPLKEFGIYIATGVGIAFALTFLILPSILSLVKPPATSGYNIRYSLKWAKATRWILRWTLKNRVSVLVGTVLLIGISLIGISKIEVNTHLLEDLRNDDPLKQDFQFLEDRFDGVRPNEIMVSVKGGGTVWDYENMIQIALVSEFVKKYYDTGPQLSLVSLVKMFNQSLNGGRVDYYRIPGTKEEYEPVRAAMLKYRKSNILKRFVTPDGKHAAISTRMKDTGSREVALKDYQFYTVLPELADSGSLHFHLTGTARLIDKNIGYLSVNMIQGLLFAFMLIAFISGVFFRSARMVLFALIPNIIPLVFIGGIMGFLGVDLKVSTSIIFTIAFGIAVDDTIHFLSRFRMELKSGRTVPFAIRSSLNITGRAIILTSIVLITGFFTLIFSDFEGTWLVGLLISLTLLFAILSDLFLLPVLLLSYRKSRR